jgi:hypothetical protein
MGMFDNVKMEYPLPDPEVQDQTFQTKDLECLLDNYTVTREGHLILHKVRFETVPEEERPGFGKPEWDEAPVFRIIGSLRRVPVGDVEIPHAGCLSIHTSMGSRETGDFRWYEYIMLFTEGRVESIRRVDARR